MLSITQDATQIICIRAAVGYTQQNRSRGKGDGSRRIYQEEVEEGSLVDLNELGVPVFEVLRGDQGRGGPGACKISALANEDVEDELLHLDLPHGVC
jgi:hypothetical protein